MASTETEQPALAVGMSDLGLGRALSWPAQASQFVGGVALVAMMGITAADVTLRNLFSVVVPGGMEMAGLLMILTALSALAVVELARAHIRVDVLVQIMPDYARLPTQAGGILLTLGAIVITAVQVVRQTLYLSSNSIVSGVLKLPEWPFVLCAAVFLALFALALLANFIAAVGEMRSRGDARSWGIFLLWLVFAAVIFGLIVFPHLLPLEMSRTTRGIVVIAMCFVLIFLGVQVSAAMALTSLTGISLLIGSPASLTSIGATAVSVVGDQIWSVVPLFTWMGLIVVASGFAEELYRAAYRWIGHLPGGLASASTVACAGLSSIVGDTLSGVYSMGSIALPQMRAYGYDMKLATASIACAATIGVMIPPSLAFIVYGMITEVSIGKLFMAGVLPGILFAPGRFPLSDVHLMSFAYAKPDTLKPIRAGEASELATGLFDAYSSDYAGTRPLIGVITPGGGFFMKEKLIRKVADVSGTRLRPTGPILASYVEAWGGSNAAFPPAEVADAISKGTIDGAMFSFEAARAFQFGNAVKKVSILPASTGLFVLTMNADSYSKLSPKARELVDMSTGSQAARAVGDLYAAAEDAGRAYMEQSGAEIVDLAIEDTREFKALSDAVMEKDIAALEGRGLAARALDAAIREKVANA